MLPTALIDFLRDSILYHLKTKLYHVIVETVISCGVETLLFQLLKRQLTSDFLQLDYLTNDIAMIDFYIISHYKTFAAHSKQLKTGTGMPCNILSSVLADKGRLAFSTVLLNTIGKHSPHDNVTQRWKLMLPPTY